MAYLAMMAVRLLELRRVLKSTGSLYLHCDPTASHYLKILFDAVFGRAAFSNELIWKRTSSKTDSTQGASHFPRLHDSILFCQKTESHFYSQGFVDHEETYIAAKYPNRNDNGRRYGLWDMTGPGGAAKGNPSYEVLGVTRYWRYSKAHMEQMIAEGRVVQPRPGAVPREKRYLDRSQGVAVGDIWTDIPPINSQAQERLGYPTQKPLALLERIISASSNEGDLILDPFCGCGTTVHAAQKLNRRWIGIDVTHLAIHLIQRRLKDAFPKISFDILGVPKDLDGARALAAQQDKYEFQKWALAMIDAQPYKGGKKGGDGGMDGFLYIKPDGKRTGKVIVSVKGGQSLNPTMVKDLIVTVEQEGAKMGVFLTLEPATKGMVTQAAAAGFYKTDYGQFPKIQIVTVEQLFGPSNPLHLPWQDTSVFKKAKRETTETQSNLDL
jgi:DNA modification methylase